MDYVTFVFCYCLHRYSLFGVVERNFILALSFNFCLFYM
jgi:hypothetical protein